MSNYNPALGRKDEYSPTTAAAVVFSHQASGGGEKERFRVLVVGKMAGRTPAPGWLGDEPGSEAARPRSLSVFSHDSQAAATGHVPTPGRAGGRAKGGKTSIANFISGQTEQIGNPNISYEATVGARILECEKQPGITGGKVPVEIWDVSGDQA
eukprot:jgi/Undpi1/11010/HiC_scaffold_30.g13310.m1